MNRQKSAAAIVVSRKRDEGPNVKYGSRTSTGEESDAGRDRPAASVAIGHQRAWSVVERRRFAQERRLSEVLVRPYGAGFVAGNSRTLPVYFMNRRMPNGASGGVGGRREQSRLLPDVIALTRIGLRPSNRMSGE